MIEWFIIGGIVGTAFLATLNSAKWWREINAEVLEELQPTDEQYRSCDNCYYSYFDEKAYPCSLCIRGVERTDKWQPKKAERSE